MTDYMRYMELSLLDDSSDDDKDTGPVCTCGYHRSDYASIQLSPNVVIQPDMLRKIITKIFHREQKDPSYYTPTAKCPQRVLLVLVDSGSTPRTLECAKHHFPLSIGNFLRESKTDIFLEELFCDRRRFKTNPSEDINFTRRRKRGIAQECTAKDLILRFQQFQRYGIEASPSGTQIKTKMRPPQLSGEWRDLLALSCCSGKTADGEEVLTRVTIADANTSEVVYDEFVKQTAQITDYRTRETGITRADMQFATRSRDEIRAEVLEKHIFANTIIVGQNIARDLRVLGVHHVRVVEINQIYPRKDHGSAADEYSIKMLSAAVLARPIAMRFADPIETTLAIVDLLREKMRNGLAFGSDMKIVESATAGGNPLFSEFVADEIELALHTTSVYSPVKGWFRHDSHTVLPNALDQKALPEDIGKKAFVLSHLEEMPRGLDFRGFAAEVSTCHDEKAPVTIIVSIGHDNEHSVFFA